MTLQDILVTVGSAVVITTALVTAIKINDLCESTVDTIEKANRVVDTLYKHNADIDNALNWVSKLPKTSPPKSGEPSGNKQ